MRKRSVAVWALGALALGGLGGWPAICPAAEVEGKIELRVSYVGHPGSEREKDFVGFLEKHFTKVGTGDLATFKEEQARDFDVVILDYDGSGSKAPRPKLGKEFTHPTVTMGVMGGRLSRELGLKTAYG